VARQYAMPRAMRGQQVNTSQSKRGVRSFCGCSTVAATNGLSSSGPNSAPA
jgi:hypothetical protein